MPVGVRAFSVYIPRLRVEQRSLASGDEDALTLAVEAAVPLAEGHLAAKGAFSGVLFATTSPLLVTSGASLLASACGVPLERLRTGDFTGLRGGVQALLAALERLQADRESADALVAAGNDGDDTGAAGAALVVGRGSLAAEFLGSHSVGVDGLPDEIPAMRAAIAGALTNANVQIADVAHFAIGAMNADAAQMLMRAIRADPTRLAPLFIDRIGHAVAAQAFLSLAAALEASRPGDLLVLAACGGGADALVFRTVASQPRSARPLAAMFEHGSASAIPPRPVLDAHFLLHRLLGARCRHCDAIRFPVEGACPACSRDGADPVRLGRLGTVVRADADHVVVDLASGGRITVSFTDAASLAPGDAVEMGLRFDPAGHLWKARPVRS